MNPFCVVDVVIICHWLWLTRFFTFPFIYFQSMVLTSCSECNGYRHCMQFCLIRLFLPFSSLTTVYQSPLLVILLSLPLCSLLTTFVVSYSLILLNLFIPWHGRMSVIRALLRSHPLLVGTFILFPRRLHCFDSYLVCDCVWYTQGPSSISYPGSQCFSYSLC